MPIKNEWFSKRGLEIFLVLLLASLVFMNLPQSWGGAEHLLFSIVFTLMMISGWMAVSSHKHLGLCIGLLAIVMISFRWFNFYAGTKYSEVPEIVATLLFYLLFAAVLSINVFDRLEVTRFKLEGAIVIYILLALIWTQMYMLVELLAPGSFHFSSSPTDSPTMRKELAYFSFTTLTTLGIGDILPLGSMARSLVSIEAVVGVLFPNILIARLVSLEIIHSLKKKS